MFVDGKRSAVILHGNFQDEALDALKEKSFKDVIVLEGRPGLEGAKVLCKELLQKKITPTLIADNMAGFLFYKDLVKEVWLSYQSIDDNGASCSIGALILGVLGKTHQVPVKIFPSSKKIKKEGKPKDIFEFNNMRVAPQGIKGYVPLVENLPRKYISEIVE